MTLRRERGGSTLVTVMVLAAVGLLLLNGMQRRLDAEAKAGNDERRHVWALNQAQSALNWGLGETWRVDDTHWQCHTLPADALTACLINVPGEEHWLLRGEGRHPQQAAPVVVYQRVAPQEPEEERSVFVALARGWLDFCPEEEESRCAGAP